MSLSRLNPLNPLPPFLLFPFNPFPLVLQQALDSILCLSAASVFQSVTMSSGLDHQRVSAPLDSSGLLRPKTNSLITDSTVSNPAGSSAAFSTTPCSSPKPRLPSTSRRCRSHAEAAACLPANLALQSPLKLSAGVDLGRNPSLFVTMPCPRPGPSTTSSPTPSPNPRLNTSLEPESLLNHDASLISPPTTLEPELLLSHDSFFISPTIPS